MASVRPVKNGFRAEVFVDGRRASKVLRTKREAAAWGAAKETELRQEAEAPPDTRYTLGDAIDRYITEVVPQLRSPAHTLRKLAYLKQQLGAATRLCDLSASRFADFRNMRLSQVKPATVRRDMVMLRSLFERARLEWLWVSENPLQHVKKPGNSPHRDRTLSWGEIKAMLKVLGYRPLGPVRSASQTVGLAMLLALRTGMRAGEICNMTWSAVRERSVYLAETKTKPREVPLSAKARRLLEKARGRHASLVLDLDRQAMSLMFIFYRKKAGLSGFTFHDTRHTAATRLAKRVDVLTLCKVMGWANPQMAMVYYNPKASDIADML